MLPPSAVTCSKTATDRGSRPSSQVTQPIRPKPRSASPSYQQRVPVNHQLSVAEQPTVTGEVIPIMEDYVPNKRWCAHRIWCRPGWPCLVISGRQLRGGLPWGVFLGSRQIRRRLPASDSRAKSPVDGQQAIDAGQPENDVPSQ